MGAQKISEEQKKRARNILQEVENGEIGKPQDILNEWKPCPPNVERSEIIAGDVLEDDSIIRKEQWVDLSKVIGVGEKNIHRLERRRVERILRWVIDDSFELKHPDPPVYNQIDEYYFVSFDGIHRTVVMKAIGVEEVFAKVHEIPVQNSVSYEKDIYPLVESVDSGSRRALLSRLRRRIKDTLVQG